MRRKERRTCRSGRTPSTTQCRPKISFPKEAYDYEAELEELLLEHERPEAAWPKGITALGRARTYRRYTSTMQTSSCG